MFQRLATISVSLIALALIAALARAQAADPPPAEGVLLLRTGRVLAGKIQRNGDRYLVTLPLGEIRLRADEVEQVCATLADIYHAKRAALPPGSAGPHLDLAAWCIAQNLWAESQRELEAARRLEPRHPRIAMLERRLASDQQAAAAPRAAPPAVEAVPAAPAADDLAADLANLPKEVMETFTAIVQPILNNHCSAAGCHGPSATSAFRLARLPNGRPNQRISQQNLRAALRLIDREHPAQSPLLMTTIKPHGLAKEAVFKARDTAKYRQLVAWVQQVAGDGARDGATAQRPGGRSGLGSVDKTRAETRPLLQPEHATPSEARREHAPFVKPPEAAKPAGLPSPSAEGQRSGPPGAGFVPRDPLDPAIFNRRHFPNRPPK